MIVCFNYFFATGSSIAIISSSTDLVCLIMLLIKMYSSLVVKSFIYFKIYGTIKHSSHIITEDELTRLKNSSSTISLDVS